MAPPSDLFRASRTRFFTGIPHLSSGAWVFLLSACAYGGALALTPDYCGSQVVYGQPAADAWLWHHLAAELSLGKGLHSSLRALYSIMLALVFQFTGWDVAVAKGVNVFLAAGANALWFAVVMRLTKSALFAWLNVLLFLADRSHLFSPHSLLTEHAGLFFNLLCAWCFFNWLDSPRRRTWWLFAAAASLGLSNLARPMSLFAVPFLVALVFFSSTALRMAQRVLLTGVFLVGIAVVIAPWTVHQKMTHGTLSISSNVAEALFAATDPRYGQWNMRLATDAASAGFKGGSAAEWNAYYFREAMKNIRHHPEFFLRNVGGAMLRSLSAPSSAFTQPRITLVACLLLAWGGLYLRAPLRDSWRRSSLLGAFPRKRLTGTATGVALGILVLTANLAALAKGLFLLPLATGILFSAVLSLPLTLALASLVAGCMLGHAMFGYDHTFTRVLWLYEPLLLTFHCLAVSGSCAMVGLLARSGVVRPVAPANAQTTAGGVFITPMLRRDPRVWVAVGLLALAVSSIRLYVINARPSSNGNAGTETVLSAQQRADVSAFVKKKCRIQRSEEESLFFAAVTLPYSMVTAAAGATRERAPLSLFGLGAPSLVSRFDNITLPYDVGYIIYGESSALWTLYPGSVAHRSLGRRVVSVGRIVVPEEPEYRDLGWMQYIESLALIPIERDNSIAFDRATVFSETCAPH